MKKTTPTTADRPKQEVPNQIVGDLVGAIRRQFCPDLDDKTWYKSYHPFIRKRVVMWPAAFIVGKGFTVPGNRYKEILLAILDEVKAHGNTDKVRYWPAYLAKCVQSHFRINWERYYEEAKSIRQRLDIVLFAAQRATTTASAADPVETIAMAQRLAAPGVRKKNVAPKKDQLTLF